MEHDTVQLNPVTDHSSRPRIGTRVAQWLGSAKLAHSSTARWEAAHEAIALLWEGEDVSPLFADAAPIELELHDYHEEFLAEKRAQFGLADQTAPLRCLLNHAATNPDD